MKKLSAKLLSLFMCVVFIFSVFPINGMFFDAEAGTILYWPVPGHYDLSRTFAEHGNQAIDIRDSTIYGAPVIAAIGGKVVYIALCGENHWDEIESGTRIGDLDCDGFGTGIVIYGDDGRWYQYAHMQYGSIPSYVYYGGRIEAGQKIGCVGDTGAATGPHLHFEINVSGAFAGHVDPMLETYGNVSAAVYYGNYPEKYSIGETDAMLSTIITTSVSISSISTVGIILYDKNGTELARKSETPIASGSQIKAWYYVNSELGYILNSGTTYQYKFFSVIGSETYYSDTYSFTTTGASCSHSYSVSTKDATCTEDGLKTFTCTSCGDIKTEVITKKGHILATINAKAATCTEVGYTAWQNCSVCETVLLAPQNIAALGHNYEAEIIEPTCTENGKTVFTCSRCNDTYEKEGSSVSDWSTEKPSAEKDKTEEKTQYRYSVKETTTSTEPYIAGWAYVSSEESYSEWSDWSGWISGSMSGNDLTEVQTATLYGYYYFTCSNCGSPMPYWGTGKCYNCGGNVDRGSWNEAYFNISWDSAGLQSWHGTSKYYTYINGQEWYQWTDGGTTAGYRYRTRTIIKTHTYEKWSNWSEWQDTAVTAESNMQVETRTLYRYFYDDQKAFGHSWGSGVVTKAATCKKVGIKTYTCSSCKETKTEEIAVTGNHSWNSGVVTKEPTVSATGIKTYTCSVCKGTKTEVIDKLLPTTAGDAVVSVDTVTTRAGATVTVEVNITKSSPLSYLRFVLDYDKDVLTLNKVTNGELFDTFDQGSNIIFSRDGDTDKTGKLMTLTFTVANDAPAGDYYVKLNCREAYNYSENDVSVSVNNGTVSVTKFIIGDVNSDNEINGKDIVRLRKYLADYNEKTGTSSVKIGGGSDVTGDGIVNGKDLVRMRKYLANYNEETGKSTVELG